MLHQSVAEISLATILLCVSHATEYGWLIQACWIKDGHRLETFRDCHRQNFKKLHLNLTQSSVVDGPSWTPPGSLFTANSVEPVWKSGQKLSRVSPLTVWTYPVDPRADPGSARWFLSIFGAPKWGVTGRMVWASLMERSHDPKLHKQLKSDQDVNSFYLSTFWAAFFFIITVKSWIMDGVVALIDDYN